MSLPTPTPNPNLVIETYRGIRNLVVAKVLTDNDTEGYTTGPVYPICGVAEIARTTESSSEAHYYDNIPAIVINNTAFA